MAAPHAPRVRIAEPGSGAPTREWLKYFSDVRLYLKTHRWITGSAAHAAAAFDRVLADTSGGAWTLILPAAPATGDEVLFLDAKGTWDTDNLTVDGNGKDIMGSSTRTYATAGDSASLVFNGTEWRERT